MSRMSNPWTTIPLDDYEKHMALEQVYQLQTLNEMMAEQWDCCPAQTVMILGIAGGNGLEHIDPKRFRAVYGVDVNAAYLNACQERHPALDGVLQTLCVDLSADLSPLPRAELLVADLLIEYIGCERFRDVAAHVKPNHISCILQIDTNSAFVSDSPYLHTFDCLDPIHRSIGEHELTQAMESLGYAKVLRMEKDLPNGKKLLRADYSF